MQENEKKIRRVYVQPVCEAIYVCEADNLMETSFPGQHNPAQPGTGPEPVSPAKQGWLEVPPSSSQEASRSLWDD